jgi:hypothetical protein
VHASTTRPTCRKGPALRRPDPRLGKECATLASCAAGLLDERVKAEITDSWRDVRRLRILPIAPGTVVARIGVAGLLYAIPTQPCDQVVPEDEHPLLRHGRPA